MPCRRASEENRHGFASRSSSAPVPGGNPLRGRGPRRRRGTSAYPFALSGVSRRPARRPAGRYGGAGAVASAAPRSTGNRSKIISTPWNGPAASALTDQRRVACPPAPNPSPIRRKTLAPFGRRGLLFCRFARMYCGNRRATGTQVRLGGSELGVSRMGWRLRRVGGPVLRDEPGASPWSRGPVQAQ
jgi:hypothetical protein